MMKLSLRLSDLDLKLKCDASTLPCKEVCGNRLNLPTTKTHTELCLKDNLPWENEIDGQGNVLRCVRAASAPSRDLFLSAASSIVCNLRLQEAGLGCHTMDAMLLITMHILFPTADSWNNANVHEDTHKSQLYERDTRFHLAKNR
jgi:hypothetical protein